MYLANSSLKCSCTNIAVDLGGPPDYERQTQFKNASVVCRNTEGEIIHTSNLDSLGHRIINHSTNATSSCELTGCYSVGRNSDVYYGFPRANCSIDCKYN